SVLICKKCWSFYHSGEVTKDEDGLDEQCRWCGEGGKLIGCDYCHNVFCKSCILRNFGRSELSVILDDSDDCAKWKCYVCDKDKLKPLVNHCDELFKKVAEDRKSREAAATRDQKKSNGVEKKSTSANNVKAGKKSKTNSGSESESDSDFDYKKSKKDLRKDLQAEKEAKKNAKERRKAKEEADDDSDSDKSQKDKRGKKKAAESDSEDSQKSRKGKENGKDAKQSKKKGDESESEDSDLTENGKKFARNGKDKKKSDLDDSDDLDKEIDRLEKGNETLEKKAKKKKKEEEKDDKKKDKSNKENGKKSKEKSKSKGTDESSSSDDGKADRDQSDEDSDDEVTIKNCLPIPKLEESQDENEQAKKDILADLDDDDDESSSVDEDSDDVPKKKSGKNNKSKAKAVKAEDCSDSDFEPVKKKRVRSSLLDEKIFESDSDEDKPKKKRKQKGGSDDDFDPGDDSDDSGVIKKKKKKKKSSSSEEENTDTDEDNKKKKRKRIKRPKNSSDEEAEEDDDDEKDSPTKGGRKKIRKVMSDKKVTDETKAAAKAEEDRRKRVSELQKKFNIVTIEDESSLTKCPITTKLVLESDKDGNPLVEVVKYLIKKLKPHQVEAIQFMWSCCIESLKRLKKEEGSGCILAHCMGLGKTLSVVSFVHTVLSASEYTNMHTCLIVSPLNTVLNWRNECSMWLREKDRMDIYELSSVKDNHARSRYLREWQRDGGILIIGYEMYRNLTNTGRVRNKKLRKVFEETLVNPGPDLVVCDEGHILKNEQSAISQAMNKIKTKRRIVLTGTPLQNNLNEYHCMLSFVKPKLLGTRKEFLNRFVNPITNGQCSDSTQHDVRVMKRRAHVLHEMLAGCVQRKDYSALTKFLPPKLEYVISVRLAPVQMTLYEKYLETSGQGVGGTIITRGGRLFQDYQALSKIWTHPWVLKLSEIRQEAKAKYDDEEDEEDELSNDSFIDDSTSDEGSMSTDDKSDDSIIMKGDSDSDAPRTRRTRGAAKKDSKNKKAKEEQPSTSKGKTEEKDEVVNTWKTRSRGGGGDNDRLLPGLNEPDTPGPISNEWWAEYLKEEDKYRLELSGKLTLLFKILQMCEEIGDKVLVFSQSLLSLDIIEDFLDSIDRKFQEEAENKTEEEKVNTFGKCWTKGADYFRMDGSTSVSLRQSWAEHFNNPENYRARLFVISTKAGGLGINLVGANRAIIFDASWNPSHDIQSIFRVYRFGQVKPVYIYRFLAQGTMEEKIYERQVTKQSLSQRVVDEHQIERHFTSSDLQALYAFTPDRLDDPNHVEKTPVLPKDTLLAELLKNQKDWIVFYHEHDSLLENKVDESLTEEERKSAWEEYEVDKDRQPVVNRAPMMNPMYNNMMGGASYNPQMNSIQQRAFSAENVSQVVQLVRSKFPQLTGDMFQAQVQNIIMQQIIQYQQQQEQEIAARQRQEMERLRMIQSQVASREKQYNQANAFGGQPWAGAGNKLNYSSLLGQPARSTMASSNMENIIRDSLTTKPTEKTPSKNPPTVVDLSKS
ncbi:transcriptional regulator ATRX, partial [Patella vulgata]|uniref:transcriptional regulator ATRX n=1 Tax=Patella vulgata TaxID=6465 RepID=UPI0021809793